jgi:hypothetical protein
VPDLAPKRRLVAAKPVEHAVVEIGETKETSCNVEPIVSEPCPSLLDEAGCQVRPASREVISIMKRY